MRKFKLTIKQIEFLKNKYPDNELVQKVLESERNGYFEIDVDTKINFMDYIEDQSVYWMGPDYEATQETIMLESIRDDIYYQTN